MQSFEFLNPHRMLFKNDLKLITTKLTMNVELFFSPTFHGLLSTFRIQKHLN